MPLRILAVIPALLLGVTPLAAQDSLSLRAGQLVTCTLQEPNFSSVTARPGEPVLRYLWPLREFGRSVFPRGSYLAGHLSDYRDPGRIAGKGWLKLDFDRLTISPSSTACLALRKNSSEAHRSVKLANRLPLRETSRTPEGLR